MGQWAFCPHERVAPLDDRRYFGFEPYIDNNVAEFPVEVTSPGHHARLMRERGLEARPREHINDLNHRRWTKGLPPLPR